MADDFKKILDDVDEEINAQRQALEEKEKAREQKLMAAQAELEERYTKYIEPDLKNLEQELNSRNILLHWEKKFRETSAEPDMTISISMSNNEFSSDERAAVPQKATMHLYNTGNCMIQAGSRPIDAIQTDAVSKMAQALYRNLTQRS